MDEKIKDQEVLLVKDQKDENLKVVTGTDEKGGLKTVPPTAEHEQSFLKFESTAMRWKTSSPTSCVSSRIPHR